MIWPGFELRVALRFLREGHMQTLLIIVGVAAGVAVIAYVSALINGLQSNTLAKTLGAQAHISLRAPDDLVTPAALPVAGAAVLTETQPRAQRHDHGAPVQVFHPQVHQRGDAHRITHRAARAACLHREAVSHAHAQVGGQLAPHDGLAR